MTGQVTQFSLPYLGEAGRTPVLGGNLLPPSCAENLVPRPKARGSSKYTSDTAMETRSRWARKSHDAAGRRGCCRSRPWRHLAASPCTCTRGFSPPAQRPGLSPEPHPPASPFPAYGAAAFAAEKRRPNPASPLTPHSGILGRTCTPRASGPYPEPGVTGLQTSWMRSLAGRPHIL